MKKIKFLAIEYEKNLYSDSERVERAANDIAERTDLIIDHQWIKNLKLSPKGSLDIRRKNIMAAIIQK